MQLKMSLILCVALIDAPGTCLNFPVVMHIEDVLAIVPHRHCARHIPRLLCHQSTRGVDLKHIDEEH